MSYESWGKRLNLTIAALNSGKKIWFRRPRFIKVEFANQEPKWHILVDRVPAIGMPGTHEMAWVALCGYRNRFIETLLDVPQLKLSGIPKRAERCDRCIAKDAAIAAAAKAAHAKAVKKADDKISQLNQAFSRKPSGRTIAALEEAKRDREALRKKTHL